MNRKHVMIAGGIVSAAVLLYCLSFGPVVYFWTLSEVDHVTPTWLDKTLYLAFRPHHWVMYHSESYFDYVFWFSNQASDLHVNFTWSEFREREETRFD